MPLRSRLLLAVPLVLATACGQEGSTPPESNPTAVEDARAVYQRGVDLSEQARFPEAVKQLRRAIEIDPELAQAHFFLGRTLVFLSHVQVGRGGERPGTDGLSITLGRDDETLAEGIDALLAARRLAPDDLEFAYWTGRALHVAKRTEEALTVLEEVVARDPTHGLAHKRLGLVHVHRGEYAPARESFERALELLPEDPGVPFQLGNILLEDDPAGARDAYKRAIEIDPTYPWAYNGLVSALSRLGDADGAARARVAFERWKVFDDGLRTKAKLATAAPEDRDAQIEAGELYFAARRWEEALPYLRRALAMDASDPLLHLYCGITLRHLGDLEVAKHHLEEAVFLAPNAVQPRIELTRLSEEVGDEERVAELVAALETEAGEFDPYDRLTLGTLLLDLNRPDQAVPHYEAVLAADPGNEEATAGLARATAEEAR